MSEKMFNLTKNSQRWAVYNAKKLCPTLLAGMGAGGGNVPLVVIEKKEMECMKWIDQSIVYGTDGGKNEFLVRVAKCDKCERYAYDYSPYGELMKYRYCPNCGKKNSDLRGG